VSEDGRGGRKEDRNSYVGSIGKYLFSAQTVQNHPVSSQFVGFSIRSFFYINHPTQTAGLSSMHPSSNWGGCLHCSYG